MSDDLVVVDEEGAPESETGIIEDTVFIGDFLLDIGKKGDVDGTESSLIAGLKSPPPVDEMRVDGASDHFAIVLSEVLGLVAELNNLGWADEGEIERVEEEQQPLALVVLQRDLFE